MDSDTQFFAQHPDRYARIRKPRMELTINNYRNILRSECEAEFRSLGDHNKDRRWIILWRVPPDNKYYDPDKPQILKIPFLLFADETVEDTDEILLPIIHELMIDEAKRQKMI
jgi:hypothetical protein